MGSKKKRKKSTSKNRKNIDNEKTKVVKTINNNDEEKPKTTQNKGKKTKGKAGKKPKKHPKLMLFIKIMIVLIVLLIIVAAGVIAGIAFGAFGNELEISKENLMIKTSNSTLYDKDGNVIVALNGEENREIISLEEMSSYVPKAFVSIEDERFYEHQGVDIKRTASATLNYLLKKGDTSYGGSTITQQLIKNATKDDEKDVTRKVKEIARAFKIEKVMTKNEILETYLNTIPLGGGGKNVYGVQVAARFYFSKSAKDLSLAESAFLAGITHSPNVYNPFRENPNTERIQKRTKTVLSKMKELGDKITEEEYNTAVQEVENGLKFQEGVVITTNNLSWFAEAAINQIVNQIAEESGLSKEAAKSRLYGGGYSIYLTQDTAIQNRVQEEWLKEKYAIKSKKEEGKTLQGAMVVMDHSNGHVLGIAGGTGEKTAFGLNRAINPSRNQPGSSIKPLATIAPGLQEGIITAASVFDDAPFKKGSYAPHNSYSGYKGLSNIRYMISISQNVSQVRLLEKVTPQKAIDFMIKMGVKSAEKADASLPLVLGAVDEVPPIEMATAYSVIANGGEYIEPTFYSKVVDSEGKIVYEPHQERNRVMSEQNAYIEQSILKEPVYTSGGTATDCKIPGQEVRGKTGTSNDNLDKWFCGFTGYYTCVSWVGYDSKETIPSGHRNFAKTSWTAVMKDIHNGLEKKDFKQPGDIVNATVCRDSGLLATDECRADPRGSRAYSEIFAKGTVPTKTCETHVKLKICKQNGKIANEFCTDTEEKVFITRPDSDKNTSWKSTGDAQYMAPTETCDAHTKAEDKTAPEINLNGAETITIKQNTKYEEKVTAKDDIDGDITSKITIEIMLDGKKVDKVDTSKVGTYTITYTVTDSSGNKTTKKRTVKVEKKEEPNKGNTTTNNTNTNSTGTNNTTNSTTNTTNKNNTVNNTKTKN